MILCLQDKLSEVDTKKSTPPKQMVWYVHFSVCLPVCLFTCLYLFTCPSVCLFCVNLSVCRPSVNWFNLYTCLSFYLSLSLCLHVSLSASLSDPLHLCRCRRPKGQQPSVVLMWDRLLMVAGVCNDTIQYPLNQFRLDISQFRLVTNQFRLEPQTGAH